MNEFPKHWRLLQLEECMDVIIDYRGKTPRKASFGVPLVTAKIVKGGRIAYDEARQEYIAYEDYDAWMRRGLPKPGDVVMTTEGPLGEIAQLDERQVALAQRLITLRGKPELLDNTFLKFLMLSSFVQDQLNARATGTTVLGIRQSELRKMSLIVPPLVEQRRIADILGALDDKIEVNRRINRTLEAMAQALFKHWFVDFGPFQDGEFVESEVGLIPGGWQVKPLSALVELLSGGTPKTGVKEYWEGEINWVAAGDVMAASPFIETTERTITQLGVENSSAKILPAFTTIITARGTVGQLGLLSREMAINQTNYGIRGTGNLGEFNTYLLIQHAIEQLKQHAYGTVFDTITRKTFDAILVSRPPNDVRKNFEGTIRPWFLKMLANQHENVKLAKTRDCLLPRLLSGEITVEAAEGMAGASAPNEFAA